MRRVCNQKDNDLQIREEVKFGEQNCIASGCIISRLAGSLKKLKNSIIGGRKGTEEKQTMRVAKQNRHE